MKHIWPYVLCLWVAACYQSAAVEMDSSMGGQADSHGTDSATSVVAVTDSDTTQSTQTSFDTATGDGQSDDGTSGDDTETVKPESDDVDTLFTHREPHFCDDLGWEDCRDASEECGRMYLEELDYSSPPGTGVIKPCGGESLFYGCAPLKYCYNNIFFAFDADGNCWLMPTGCLPNEPGWTPAVDDDYCNDPIATLMCIE